jgi:hypothetical protein
MVATRSSEPKVRKNLFLIDMQVVYHRASFLSEVDFRRLEQNLSTKEENKKKEDEERWSIQSSFLSL